jgi:O-acetyl-ADP-ribose deacetylase (regulator of RNase III)
MHHVIGNLLESDCDYICHQVNCQGKMNSGIAKSIRDKWPIVYNNYMTKYNETEKYLLAACGRFEVCPDVSEVLLGDIQLVCLWDNYHATDFHQSVINMFAQQHFGYDGRRYTSYDAFWSCLGKIKDIVPVGKKIGFPGRIGCVRGGANWDVIYEMINQVLGQDYEVYIYFLEGENEN